MPGEVAGRSAGVLARHHEANGLTLKPRKAAKRTGRDKPRKATDKDDAPPAGARASSPAAKPTRYPPMASEDRRGRGQGLHAKADKGREKVRLRGTTEGTDGHGNEDMVLTQRRRARGASSTDSPRTIIIARSRRICAHRCPSVAKTRKRSALTVLRVLCVLCGKSSETVSLHPPSVLSVAPLLILPLPLFAPFLGLGVRKLFAWKTRCRSAASVLIRVHLWLKTENCPPAHLLRVLRASVVNPLPAPEPQMRFTSSSKYSSVFLAKPGQPLPAGNGRSLPVRR